jgi:hypothetical protein
MRLSRIPVGTGGVTAEWMDACCAPQATGWIAQRSRCILPWNISRCVGMSPCTTGNWGKACIFHLGEIFTSLFLQYCAHVLPPIPEISLEVYIAFSGPCQTAWWISSLGGVELQLSPSLRCHLSSFNKQLNRYKWEHMTWGRDY